MIVLPPTEESLAFLRLVATLARKYNVPLPPIVRAENDEMVTSMCTQPMLCARREGSS